MSSLSKQSTTMPVGVNKMTGEKRSQSLKNLRKASSRKVRFQKRNSQDVTEQQDDISEQNRITEKKQRISQFGTFDNYIATQMQELKIDTNEKKLARTQKRDQGMQIDEDQITEKKEFKTVKQRSDEHKKWIATHFKGEDDESKNLRLVEEDKSEIDDQHEQNIKLRPLPFVQIGRVPKQAHARESEQEAVEFMNKIRYETKSTGPNRTIETSVPAMRLQDVFRKTIDTRLDNLRKIKNQRMQSDQRFLRLYKGSELEHDSVRNEQLRKDQLDKLNRAKEAYNQQVIDEHKAFKLAKEKQDQKNKTRQQLEQIAETIFDSYQMQDVDKNDVNYLIFGDESTKSMHLAEISRQQYDELEDTKPKK